MNDGSGDLDRTREVQEPGAPDAAFQNDLLAAWLDDVARGEVHDVAHYQAKFRGREAEVAAELARLSVEDADEDVVPRIPDVEILEKIGSGGQGVVYRGRQNYIEREVAVKVFAPKFWSDSFADRFRREAKTLASLRHANIVACFQAGTTDAGVGFMIMELVEGRNLREWIHENGPMDPSHALLLCRDLARALAHAHDASIIHRDVKPENVLLRPLPQPSAEGLPFEVKLADLGLARVGSRIVGDAARPELTPVGAVMGSPLTMAPEQFDDPENVDFRADIYGLGCVLFHALAGRAAFQSEQLTALVQEKVAHGAPDVRKLEAAVPPDVAALVRSMLDADPVNRPGSHAEVAERCDSLALGGRRPRLSRTAIAVVALLLLATITFVAWDPLGMVRPPTVAVVVTENPMEGQSVTLRAEVSGRGEFSYLWSQVGEPKLPLTDVTGSALTFRAPRGVGDHEFEFALTVANRWRSTTQTEKIRIGAVPELAPLRAGESRALLREEQSAVVADWRKVSGIGTWAGAQPGHVGANGYCNQGTTRQSRFLPRGKWLLAGAIEPFASTWMKGSMERTERAGLEFAFSSGHVAGLEVRSDPVKTGFVAGIGHRRGQDPGVWRLVDRIAGSWDEGQPLQFEIEWTGAALVFSFGSKKGAADWVTRTVVARDLPSSFPPNEVSIYVVNGRACFCRLAIHGR